MQNVLLIVLLLLALALIAVVLLQRSEGGGLGMGGGGPAGQRAKATGLTKLTWVFGVTFMAVSLGLTVLAARNSEGTSVMDRLGGGSAPPPVQTEGGDGLLLPPPPAADIDPDTPLVPRAD